MILLPALNWYREPETIDLISYNYSLIYPIEFRLTHIVNRPKHSIIQNISLNQVLMATNTLKSQWNVHDFFL